MNPRRRRRSADTVTQPIGFRDVTMILWRPPQALADYADSEWFLVLNGADDYPMTPSEAMMLADAVLLTAYHLA